MNSAQHVHTAIISWQRRDDGFATGRYSRAHTWAFDGGLTVPASPAPSVVRPPWSDPAAVDPEEAFVAALSSCHMLTWLWLAGKAGFVVNSYRDEARGFMEKNAAGVPWVAKVELRPQVMWSGDAPTADKLAELHHHAHEQCFIAASVKTEVVVVPG